MIQRKTQTANYWQKQFAVTSQDIEFIYHRVLEQGHPLDFDTIALALVSRHCDAEELATRSELQEGVLYQPKDSYKVGDKLVFPALDFAVGAIVSSREGHHPEYGKFSVIAVDFQKGGPPREFAADFQHDHALNMGSDQSLANLQGLMSPEELYKSYEEFIRPKIAGFLKTNGDFIEFHEQYFLRDLLPEFNEGLFNIADAAIDINHGPLSVDALIEQMGLVNDSTEITDLTRFSVSYRLANDERFEDVGPKGQVLWYLERMEPPEVKHPPRRLQASGQAYNISRFDDDLLDLLAEIDDEATHPDHYGEVEPNEDQVTVVLNYPHHRVGTLPLTPKTDSFFPMSHYNPVLFEFIDGRTGHAFPGWTVWEHRYVFGLDDWYKKNKLPVGAYITIKRTPNPMQVIVDFQPTRSQRDWVRMGAVVSNRLTFQMNPAAIGCKYDELMIISESNTSNIDSYWVTAEERNMPIFDLLCLVFPELSKLNPQSTVHAKTLYSAVNVVRRAAPGVVFQELVSHPCFIPINHGYWTYDPSLRD